MARIRSIKPEFWTSEQIAECSPIARLMFIGMWNFCDDYGVIPASVKRLKMQLFPSDESIGSDDIRRMITELSSNGLIEEYSVENKEYWYVTGWDSHQKPDCKTGLYPRPDGQIGTKIRRKNADHSPNVRQPFAQGEGEGEGKGKGEGEGEVKPTRSASADKAKRRSRIPEDYSPKESHVAKAKTKGLSLSDELEGFKDFHTGKGSVMADWDAAFHTWLRNSTRFGGKKPQQSQQTFLGETL